MNERQLRYACGVWRERSFSRAAERMHVSQPSLSDQVRLLEEEIGFPIFYRGPRGIEPSVNGLVFLERASEVLNSLTRLEDLGRRLRGQEYENFRVGFNTGITDHFLADVSRIVSTRSTRLRLEVATSTNRRLQRLVHQGKLDAGFLLNADLANWSDKLKVVKTLESELVLVCAAGHLPADMAHALDFKALATHPLIVNETELGLGRAVMAAFQEAGVEPNIVADCDNVSSVKTMVASGFGMALLPRICVLSEVEVGSLLALPLVTPVYIPIQLVTGLRSVSPVAQSFCQQLVDHLTALRQGGQGGAVLKRGWC